MYKRSLRQLRPIRWFRNRGAFAGQRLQNRPMIEVVVVGVRVNVGQSPAVDLGIGERPRDLWLEVFLALEITSIFISDSLLVGKTVKKIWTTRVDI